MFTMPMQWRRGPQADEGVVTVAEEAAEAARKGLIRVMAIVTISPTLDVEFIHAGELDEVRRTLLIGGLTRLIRHLSE